MSLAKHSDTSQAQASGAAGLLRRQTAAQIIVREQRQVGIELLLEVLIETLARQ